MTCSVVICTYTEKRWQRLVAAVGSVERQTLVPTEVVVVVDHNLDLLSRVRAQLRHVVALENPGEPGLADAKNAGVSASTADFVAFLDDDAEAEPDWLEHLLAPYASPAVMGVGGRTDSVWETPRPGWFPLEFEWVVGGSYAGMPREAGPVRNVHGGNMSFRRELLLEIGGFSPNLGRVGARPVGCEDTELCIRMRQRWPSREVVFAPEARILHHVPAQRARWSYYVSRCYFEGASKARVASSVGTRDALSTERVYATRILGGALVMSVFEVAVRGRLIGLLRSAAIVLGLVAAITGYTIGAAATTLANAGGLQQSERRRA